jgi:hypothetical protein
VDRIGSYLSNVRKDSSPPAKRRRYDAAFQAKTLRLLFGCEKVSTADLAPQPGNATKAALTIAPETYTPAQQAWLNFVDKVQKGEQIDPTGQYVKDGTIQPTGSSKPHKLDAAKDKLPFTLRADGTIVVLPKPKAKTTSGGAHTNMEAPIDPCTLGDRPSLPSAPTVTSTFVSSVGQGGSGTILDLKLEYSLRVPVTANYIKLNADLNKGAGGSYIYFLFTRDPNTVAEGIEYQKGSGYVDNQSVTGFMTANGSNFGQPSTPASYYPIWYPNNNPNIYWNAVDLNGGAGEIYLLLPVKRRLY